MAAEAGASGGWLLAAATFFWSQLVRARKKASISSRVDAQVDVLDALARDFDGDAGDGELHGAASLLLDEIGAFFIVRESGGAGKARTRIFSADVEYRC